MNPAIAAQLINSLIYRPEWKFEAEPATNRFQDAVRVKVTYQARNTDREQAPNYETWITGGARASVMVMVGPCMTADDVCRKLLEEVIMPIELHEAREFLRYPGTLVAPFHPHNHDTMAAWGKLEYDLTFGLA